MKTRLIFLVLHLCAVRSTRLRCVLAGGKICLRQNDICRKDIFGKNIFFVWKYVCDWHRGTYSCFEDVEYISDQTVFKYVCGRIFISVDTLSSLHSHQQSSTCTPSPPFSPLVCYQVYSARLFYIAVIGIVLMIIAREIEYIYGDAGSMKWVVIGLRCTNSLVRISVSDHFMVSYVECVGSYVSQYFVSLS